MTHLARGRDPLRSAADLLVDRLVAKGSFGAVTNLARWFPVEVVGDLIGLPREGRERLLPLLDAKFNCFGPDNARTQTSFPQLPELAQYVMASATRGALPEDSMGRAVYGTVDAGEIPEAAAPWLVMTYVTAGMDTTVHAIGHTVWLMAQHPDQWDALRADRSLVPQAFSGGRALRVTGPGVRTTARVDRSVGDVTAGARLAVLYGSANRDERKWADADRFDITRNNLDHLGFGYGLHGCAGQALARLEGEAILRALLRSVSRIEAGDPVRHFNHILPGFAASSCRP